jgi:hypothetical protein
MAKLAYEDLEVTKAILGWPKLFQVGHNGFVVTWKSPRWLN